MSKHPKWTAAEACHHCDNPPCVNQEHIFAGTHKENVADMIQKGRADHSGLALGRGVKRGFGIPLRSAA